LSNETTFFAIFGARILFLNHDIGSRSEHNTIAEADFGSGEKKVQADTDDNNDNVDNDVFAEDERNAAQPGS
jgi:hypothetical protein